MEDREIRAALDRHWAASDANDFEAEHQIYREDAVLEYPRSGERIRGRRNIQASRFAQPSRKRFTVRRILGAADLWISELVIAYDPRPSYTVSIMEFRDGKVARETQYFGDPFEPGPSRAQWVERNALKPSRHKSVHPSLSRAGLPIDTVSLDRSISTRWPFGSSTMVPNLSSSRGMSSWPASVQEHRDP